MKLPPVRHRTVLITGCSTGIGRATADELKARGWRVLASARKPSDVETLRAAGFDALQLDVADEASVDRGAANALAWAGGCVGALVNNAGFGQPGAMELLSRDLLRRQFETNVFGLQDLTNRLLPAMRAAGSGRVVQVSSVLGRLTLPMVGAYCASKHAVEAMAEAQRIELRSTGIGVILVEPGPIETAFRKTAAVHAEATVPQGNGSFGSHYAAAIRDRMSAKGATAGFTQQPSSVARVIADALESPRPRARYPVTLPAQLGPAIRALVPDELYDLLMARRLVRRQPAAPAPSAG